MKQKKLSSLLLVIVLCFSILTLPVHAKTNYKKIYRNYAAQQKKADSNIRYMAIVDLKQPVLLLTDSYFKFQGKNAISAEVYQYNKKKVQYIGKLQSTGTAYPICKTKNTLLAGFHHTSFKLSVKNGKGTLKVLDGLYLDKKNCTYSKYKLKNNITRLIEKKAISTVRAEKEDYYIQDETYAGKPIKFKKIK